MLIPSTFSTFPGKKVIQSNANRENKFREIHENLSIAKISYAKLTHDLSNRENLYP